MNLTGRQVTAQSGILEISKIAQHILNLLHKFFIVFHLIDIKFKLHVLKSTTVTGGDNVLNPPAYYDRHVLKIILVFKKKQNETKKISHGVRNK